MDTKPPAPEVLPLVVALCEGRVRDAVGVKLLLASLAEHAPGARVLAYLSPPLARVMEGELARIHPNTRIIDYHGPENWSCKPTVLLAALQAAPGCRVLWLDVDIIVAGPLDGLASVPAEVLIVAEESNAHENKRVVPRQQALRLPPHKPRETTLSSCVIGITQQHEPLLRQWQKLMDEPAFLAEQAKPAGQRKLFFGDQEVWEATLCLAEHDGVPLHWLFNGHEMLQATYSAYVPPPRVKKSGPLFIHATGELKPWRAVKHRLTQEIFPYFRHARRYRPAMSVDQRRAFSRRSPTAWMWQHLLGGFASYQWLRQTMSRRRKGKRMEK